MIEEYLTDLNKIDEELRIVHSQWRKDEYRDNLKWHILKSARARAKSKNIPFDIKIEDIDVPTHCPVLGIKLQINDDSFKDSSPSLDKINNSRGYVRGNIAVISYRANRIKSDATLEELIKIVNYMNNNNSVA